MKFEKKNNKEEREKNCSPDETMGFAKCNLFCTYANTFPIISKSAVAKLQTKIDDFWLLEFKFVTTHNYCENRTETQIQDIDFMVEKRKELNR